MSSFILIKFRKLSFFIIFEIEFDKYEGGMQAQEEKFFLFARGDITIIFAFFQYLLKQMIKTEAMAENFILRHSLSTHLYIFKMDWQ